MQLDFAKLSAAISFVNEIDAHVWRKHVLSIFRQRWELERQHAKKTT